MRPSEPRVIVGLSGGLGNQMFQYAFGRSLAMRRGARLFLDVGPIAQDAARSFALGGFRTAAALATEVDVGSLRFWPRPALRWVPRWPGRLPYVKERTFTFDPDVLEHTAPAAYWYGYWQSERYFSDISDTIRDDFQLTQPFSEARHVIAGMIANENTVSVHVRRGDYVSNAAAHAYHGVCAPEWYGRAMRAMGTTVANPTFFIFSDDPEWARANLSAQWPCVFVEPQADGRDFEDMHLMASCRHHIIANSSFSWWGAWLNPRPNKRVIAPARWFNGAGHDTRDLLPESWERL